MDNDGVDYVISEENMRRVPPGSVITRRGYYNSEKTDLNNSSNSSQADLMAGIALGAVLATAVWFLMSALFPSHGIFYNSSKDNLKDNSSEIKCIKRRLERLERMERIERMERLKMISKEY